MFFYPRAYGENLGSMMFTSVGKQVINARRICLSCPYDLLGRFSKSLNVLLTLHLGDCLARLSPLNQTNVKARHKMCGMHKLKCLERRVRPLTMLTPRTLRAFFHFFTMRTSRLATKHFFPKKTLLSQGHEKSEGAQTHGNLSPSLLGSHPGWSVYVLSSH